MSQTAATSVLVKKAEPTPSSRRTPRNIAGLEPAPPGRPKPSTQGELLGGRYRLLRLLGAGGMGEVHEALDIVVSRSVAVKRILAPLAKVSEIRERFAAEISALARVQHPTVINITDKGVDANGAPYFVMEYAAGVTLKQVLERGAMPPARALLVATRILRGLVAAHAAGVIHRDLKPQNVLMIDDEHLKIVDFGIAKALCGEHSDLTGDNVMMGTPGYMAPEVALGRGSSHPTVDIFAVGVILYELLTGRQPFDPTTRSDESASQGGLGDVPRLAALVPGVPLALERAITRALDLDPSRRFQSAEEFLSALECLGDLRVVSLAPGEVIDGKYVIQRRLARGGTAVVYLATDQLIGRTVVLKFLFLGDNAEPDERLRQRFFQDAALADQVRHPGVVRIYGAGTALAHPFLVMEHVEGRTFREAWGDLDWEAFVGVVKAVAGALTSVHASGIVHRDVSPENIVVQPDGTPKLLDFGAARRPNSELTASGALEAIGRPGYQSPEQAWRPQSVTGASDQWSLAAVVYEAVTGRLPFEDPGADLAEPAVMNRLIDRLLNEAQPVAPANISTTVSPELSATLLKALARDPADRFESITAFATALAAATEDGAVAGPVSSPPATTEQVPRRHWRSRPRNLTALSVVLLLAAVAAFGWSARLAAPTKVAHTLVTFRPPALTPPAERPPLAPTAVDMTELNVTASSPDTSIVLDGSQLDLPAKINRPRGQLITITVVRQGYITERVMARLDTPSTDLIVSATRREHRASRPRREKAGMWDRTLDGAPQPQD